MFKPLELFVGLRYTRSKHKNNFISFISLASMLGILFGVLVLIIVLSVMNGFEKEFRDRILSMVSHVTVSETDGLLSDWRKQQQDLLNDPKIQGSAPYIENQVMISANGVLRGVVVQGILPEEQHKVGDVGERMVEGDFNSLQPRSYNIALGVELAQLLGVFPGDKVTVVTPHIRVTPAGMIPRSKRFTVSSVYKINLPEYDSSTAFIHMRDASKLFKTRDKVTGIRLKLDDLFDAPQLANQLQSKLGSGFMVSDWGQENKSLFEVQKTEKVVMFFILFLIVLVAVFNLISSLVMVVNDKQADIAILRTQGMSSSQVKRIFMVQGTIIGFVGALLGALFGVLIASNLGSIVATIEQLFGVELLPQGLIYASSRFPSVVDNAQVISISIAAFVLAMLATLYPASQAAKVQPAESLRYE
jgi:lipoprotein-releasing system permease protein